MTDNFTSNVNLYPFKSVPEDDELRSDTARKIATVLRTTVGSGRIVSVYAEWFRPCDETQYREKSRAAGLHNDPIGYERVSGGMGWPLSRKAEYEKA